MYILHPSFEYKFLYKQEKKNQMHCIEECALNNDIDSLQV